MASCMRRFSLVIVVACLTIAARSTHRGAPGVPEVRPNSNTERAGVLRNGVLSVTLDARTALYHINGPSRAPMTIEAFTEPGKGPVMPGPLVRAPVGTEIQLTVHNSLARRITFFVPQLVRGGPDRIDAVDSVVVEPGATGVLTTRATTPGNYAYAATLPAAHPRGWTGLLAGALIVDAAKSAEPEHDHVFVIMATWDSLMAACGDTAARPGNECSVGRVVRTINGRSWPSTERITATVGDSLHWRVINAGGDIHPMHLHGFYYRVDEYNGWVDDVESGRPLPGQLVATQALPKFAGMAMSWSPDRPGNWLFHCHFSVHLQADSMSAMPDDPHLRDMVGLVIGINVKPRQGVEVAGEPRNARHLRLVAMEDSTDSVGHSRVILPSMHFILEERDRRVDAGSDFSPQLDLVRGEPVAITIVNHMTEPTSIHWHGIEVQDSYMDGVAGFSGTGNRRAPAIAPGDSFTARFTPPRAGTFMYHAHVDDDREQSAGLIGAVIVRDPGTPPSPDDHVFFIKSSRLGGLGDTPPEINGQMKPDTVVLRAGKPARLRFINLSAHHNTLSAGIRLEALDGAAGATGPAAKALAWIPLAKDGADLPAGGRVERPARQVISIGETYDFAYTPQRPGTLRLVVTSAPGPLERSRPEHPLIVVPIRVE